mgnify:FL=1
MKEEKQWYVFMGCILGLFALIWVSAQMFDLMNEDVKIPMESCCDVMTPVDDVIHYQW